MNPILERRLFATQSYYKVAEMHTKRCKDCLKALLESSLQRWEHMTGQEADRRGSITDIATRFGLNAMKETERHTNECDSCLEISIDGFELRFAHADEVRKRE